MQPPSDGNLRSFGRALRVARTVRGVKRRDIAQRTGLSYAYLSQVERGVRTPSSRAMQAIADALDMTASELLAMADSTADTTPHDGVGASAPSVPDETQRSSRWFSAPPAPMAMGAMPAPATHERAPESERPTDQDLAQLVASARELERSDVQLLIELARRLRG